MSLQRLKSFNVDQSSLEQLIELDTFAVAYGKSLDHYGLEHEQWYTEVREEISREIKSRSRAQVAARVRELENRLEALKSTTEKKKETLAELDRLKTQLAGAGA